MESENALARYFPVGNQVFIVLFTFTKHCHNTSHQNINKLQSKTADFDPVPPPGELNEALFLILARYILYVKTWLHLQNGNT